MGVVASHLTRHMRRFNVIQRSERVISKEKPTPAPLHKIDAERLKTLFKNDPQTREELINKNSVLEHNLQTVYVTSKGDIPDVYSQSKSKLPKSREPALNSCFMVEDPKYVPPGRYTLTQIIECVADHYKDKEMYTAQVLADRIKIDKKLMENILKYYKIFDMYIPPNMLEKKRKNQSLISDAIDNIRIGLEMDKYSKERKQIGKD